MRLFSRPDSPLAALRDRDLEFEDDDLRFRSYTAEDLMRRCDWAPYDEKLLGTYNYCSIAPSLRAGLYRRIAANATAAWFSVDLPPHKTAAVVSMRELDFKAGSGRLGISVDKQFFGRRLGQRAIMVFLAQYFTEWGGQQVVLDVALWNSRAIRCYERCGFIEDRYYSKPLELNFDPLRDPSLADAWQYITSDPGGNLSCTYMDMTMDKEQFSRCYQLWRNAVATK